MKQAYTMISLLIPFGLLSPGNDIYVYLCPLLQELRIDGEGTYDHSRKETF